MAEQWTIRTLKKHFDALRKADKEAVSIALAAANEKSDSHNHILAAMRDQQSTFVRIVSLDALSQRTDKIELELKERGGKQAGFGQFATLLFAAVGVAGTLFTIASAWAN